DGGWREDLAALASSDMDAVAQITSGVGRGQRLEIELRADPLRERAVRAVPQAVAQLGLSDENDGDQVAVVELEIREQADFFERRLARDEVRLVHDEQRRPSGFVQCQELSVDLLQKI